jgi:trans-aconitate methyltransferase
MTTSHTFDGHARNNVATIERAIGVSGERHDYFVELKADLTRSALRDAKPALILDFGCGVGLSTHALAGVYPGAFVLG